jgi:hypothetical protein
MPLRDIRPDLKERLGLIGAQTQAEHVEYERDLKSLQDRHNSRLQELKADWDSINNLLISENKRHGGSADQPTESAGAAAPTMPLDDYLVERVREHGVRSKADLKADAEAKGYAPRGEGGRKVHFTLLNILRARRLVQAEGNQYMLPPQPAEFDLGQRRMQ